MGGGLSFGEGAVGFLSLRPMSETEQVSGSRRATSMIIERQQAETASERRLAWELTRDSCCRPRAWQMIYTCRLRLQESDGGPA